VFDVLADRAGADIKRTGDLRVGVARCDPCEDIKLAGGEAVQRGRWRIFQPSER